MLLPRTPRKRSRKIEDVDLPGSAHVAVPPFDRIEYHRHGLCLLPEAEDPNPGVAFLMLSGPIESLCTCKKRRGSDCRHLPQLEAFLGTFPWTPGQSSLSLGFEKSVWFRLQNMLLDTSPVQLRSVSMALSAQGGKRGVVVSRSGGDWMVKYTSDGPDLERFIERVLGADKHQGRASRTDALAALMVKTATESERMMEERGGFTIRRAREWSFYHRLTYHAYREFGDCALTLIPVIDRTTGAFILRVDVEGGLASFLLNMPRARIPSLVAVSGTELPPLTPTLVHRGSARAQVKLRPGVTGKAEACPQVILDGGEGAPRTIAAPEFEKFLYANVVYLPEIDTLARLVPDFDRVLHLRQLCQSAQSAEDSAAVLSEVASGEGGQVLSAQVFSEIEQLEIVPQEIDQGDCWISASYRAGDQEVSLVDILNARARGQRFLTLESGWLDCQAQVFDPLRPLLSGKRSEGRVDPKRGVRLTRRELMRLLSSESLPVRLDPKAAPTPVIERLRNLEPTRKVTEFVGLRAELRPYQKRGVEWLLFLQENGFGGLLCDDMGLGKTHQVFGLMLAMKEAGMEGRPPFLVVCPTTVLSHWERLILRFAPALRPGVFHGLDRDLKETLAQSDVVLTTYGLVRNHVEELSQIQFPLVIFDEAQNLKNAGTQSYQAARQLQADMWLGLTGTPVENRVEDLLALFGLVMNGYLGEGDELLAFSSMGKTSQLDEEKHRRLKRLVSPFILRRLKASVLQDLPEKIEDLRFCQLSEEQAALYAETMSQRAPNLLTQLRKTDEPVPYIHVFALLNRLKQICDHPALVLGTPEKYRELQCGKWDVFVELLEEALGSEQKVVVYSQYLDMLRVMELYLAEREVGFVKLTGQTRHRGQVVQTFQEDPDCRVILGSLKAGGVGIDLTSASVVIHYDRWWNAAKEEQATDRVHRIGQQRGVQVFKLITESTLEQRIASIIEHKKDLLESTVPEDDPEALKTFSREDLIAILEAR